MLHPRGMLQCHLLLSIILYIDIHVSLKAYYSLLDNCSSRKQWQDDSTTTFQENVLRVLEAIKDSVAAISDVWHCVEYIAWHLYCPLDYWARKKFVNRTKLKEIKWCFTPIRVSSWPFYNSQVEAFRSLTRAWPWSMRYDVNSSEKLKSIIYRVGHCSIWF